MCCAIRSQEMLTINSVGRVRQCLASEIAVAVVFAIAYSHDSRTWCAILWYRPILQAARQTTAGSTDFRSPATAIKVSQSRHNSRTKLRMKLLHIQKRDNVEFYLCCKFQLSPFSVRRKTDVKDGKIAPQVLMPRGNISYLAHISCSDNTQ